jgi:hypothetical protein
MPSNKKPVLSVLIDGDKRDRFSWLCQRSGRPMAYAINKFIDRCLECGSIELPTDLVLEYSGGDQLVDGLLGMMPRLQHGLQRLGQERLKQEITPENGVIEDSEGDYYDPETDPELAWVYESSEAPGEAESSSDQWGESDSSDVPDPDWMDEHQTTADASINESRSVSFYGADEVEDPSDPCREEEKAKLLAEFNRHFMGRYGYR